MWCAKGRLWNDIRHGLKSKYIMRKSVQWDICDHVVLQSVVCKWAGQFGECASGTSAPLQRPGTPQHQVLEPIFSHTYTFWRNIDANESLQLVWFSKPCLCPASFTLSWRCPDSMLPCVLLFIYFFKLPFLVTDTGETGTDFSGIYHHIMCCK